MRCRARTWLTLALAAAAHPVAHAAAPEEIPGLVARYEASTIHGRSVDGDKVLVWPDSSGQGHDLRFPGRGLAALVRDGRLSGRPVVEVRKAGYDVSTPFELRDHTIFLVHRADLIERALLSSDADPTFGIVLHEQGKRHLWRTGAVGTDPLPYTEHADRTDDFEITVLGREAGRLRAFADGIEVSSGLRSATPLRVGKFFNVVYSQFVDRDADGLQVAEMLFYDRFLDRADRAGVTAYLVERYGLAGQLRREEPLAGRLTELREAEDGHVLWLSTEATPDLAPADDVAAVPWTVRERVDEPFSVKAAPLDTRITCTRSASLVRLYVSLGLSASRPGAKLRLLLLKNGAEYHDEDASSGEFGGEGTSAEGSVALEATLFLDEGEWIEVVTEGVGAPGEIRLDPARSLLAAEVR